ncbi:type II toxin-antitoxin system PemK/MazF family toxin [Agromyces bauzanensis]|uniref:mRNA interferase PemK n=1 Tax=Agromyces bauzanensis TaxID=1308924 RepID=A0A917PF61_9MICO|nr:type II toxin-antitoxin system PemK/MazF family toxin [Agromyces bauzanensis]GGJ74058.1 mRNA interferase PemK [Agromyces bauzanensis]
MPDTSRFLTALGRVIRSFSAGRSGAARTDVASRASTTTGVLSPGQAGPDATIELDPRAIRRVRLAYAPARDGEPDPGEIVWTWVPYVENDGRGKDRPVVIVATSGSGNFLAVQLTSKPRDGDRDHVPLGDGAWDTEGRPSWARIDRVFRVRAGGMRREAASLDAERYARLASALRERYGWH